MTLSSLMVNTVDQQVVWVSDSFAVSAGRPTDDLTGGSIFDLLDASTLEEWAGLFRDSNATDRQFDRLDVHLVGDEQSVDRFELCGVRYVDHGRNVMVSLSSKPAGEISTPRGAKYVKFDGVLLNLDDRTITIDGKAFDTPAKEFELLAFLAARPGEVFTRAELLHYVWASKPEWQDSDTVTEHIHRLRAKIETDPTRPTILRTVRGKGYCFQSIPD